MWIFFVQVSRYKPKFCYNILSRQERHDGSHISIRSQRTDSEQNRFCNHFLSILGVTSDCRFSGWVSSRDWANICRFLDRIVLIDDSRAEGAGVESADDRLSSTERKQFGALETFYWRLLKTATAGKRAPWFCQLFILNSSTYCGNVGQRLHCTFAMSKNLQLLWMLWSVQGRGSSKAWMLVTVGLNGFDWRGRFSTETLV